MINIELNGLERLYKNTCEYCLSKITYNGKDKRKRTRKTGFFKLKTDMVIDCPVCKAEMELGYREQDITDKPSE